MAENKKTDFKKFTAKYRDGKFIGLMADDKLLALDDLVVRKVRLIYNFGLVGDYYIVGEGDYHYTLALVCLPDFPTNSTSVNVDKKTIDNYSKGLSEDGYEIIDITNAIPTQPLN